MHDIFISYSRADTPAMNRIVEALREAQFNVWTDQGIAPGTQSWRDMLGEAIINCGCVVVLFSP